MESWMIVKKDGSTYVGHGYLIAVLRTYEETHRMEDIMAILPRG